MELFMDELPGADEPHECDIEAALAEPAYVPPMPPASRATPAPEPPSDVSDAEYLALKATDKSVNFRFGGGLISYYHKGKRFQAICPNADHGKCVLTRTGRAGAGGQGGRPLGVMAHSVLNHTQPKQVEHVYAPDPPLDARQLARETLKEVPGAHRLFKWERKLLAGEPEEPVVCV